MSTSVPSPAALRAAAHDPELHIMERYGQAALAVEPALCCPVSYDPRYLAAIPAAVIERDYGCGDPSAHLREGEVVLDLGSGTGKICFIASQVVGPSGRVIGVDMNLEMLALARASAPEVAKNIGYGNVEFRRGRIQDLGLDLDRVDALLARAPIGSADALIDAQRKLDALRTREPLVADASVDVVISNCVLNLVRPADKRQLFAEMHRVLRRGGRAVISDIVADEDVPQAMQDSPELWSGCISRALREDRFFAAFEEAGFYGVTALSRQTRPWQVVGGLEFRSVTVAAYKGKEGPCIDRKQAVIYRGPFREVWDDDGHQLVRGVRTAVCEKTFAIYGREPYREHFEPVPPSEPPALDDCPPFPCGVVSLVRDPRETRGAPADTTPSVGTCGSAGSCC